MTHVSRRKLPKSKEDQLKSALKDVFSNLKSNESEKVISSLITKTEQIMLAKRLMVIIMLSEGVSYDKISKSLHLTNQTISYIHSEVKYSPEQYSFLVNKLTSWKRKELLKALLKGLGLEVAKLAAKHAGGRI